jgi:hypothetical protein
MFICHSTKAEILQVMFRLNAGTLYDALCLLLRAREIISSRWTSCVMCQSLHVLHLALEML